MTLHEQLVALGVMVDKEVEVQLSSFLDELLRWNRTYNLTAVRDRAEGIEKHLVDSLTVLPLLVGNERLLDLGSGGGFPCLPLKVAAPGLSIVSVDSVGKKILFQRHAARNLGLRDFTALQARAEELPLQAACREGFSVVVARAFTSLANLASYALPLLRPGGRLIAMKGPEGEEELEQVRELLAGQQLQVQEVRRLTLPVSRAERRLIVFQKAG